MRGLVIAIDGVVGAGKTTTARMVAGRLGYRHLDTGAMYRAVTVAATRRGIAAGGNSKEREPRPVQHVQQSLHLYIHTSHHITSHRAERPQF